MTSSPGTEVITTLGNQLTVRSLPGGAATTFNIGPVDTLATADLDGSPGDEIFYTNGSLLTVLKIS